MQDLSVVEKLVLVAHSLDIIGKRVFSIEDFVVRAWKMFPETFGLRGHLDEKNQPKYPDSNRVYAEIMGSKPLRSRGLIEKVGTKKYRLTDSGMNLAGLLLKRENRDESSKTVLPREVVSQIVRLLDSRAFKKISEDNLEGVTFFDACNFWNITARSYAIELEGKLAEIRNCLNLGEKTIGDKSVSTEHGGRGRSINAEDIKKLNRINELLHGKFESELETIRSRIDQRRRPEF